MSDRINSIMLIKNIHKYLEKGTKEALKKLHPKKATFKAKKRVENGEKENNNKIILPSKEKKDYKIGNNIDNDSSFNTKLFKTSYNTKFNTPNEMSEYLENNGKQYGPTKTLNKNNSSIFPKITEYSPSKCRYLLLTEQRQRNKSEIFISKKINYSKHIRKCFENYLDHRKTKKKKFNINYLFDNYFLEPKLNINDLNKTKSRNFNPRSYSS